MIAPLLEALREKDPATWAWLCDFVMFDDGDVRNSINIASYGEGPGFDAILQYCLQEACQARGWSWRMQGFPEIDDDHPGQTCCTIMRRKGIIWYDHKTAYGASPAEALLAAYLEALSVA